jgi:hypothetical protein
MVGRVVPLAISGQALADATGGVGEDNERVRCTSMNQFDRSAL